MLFFALFLGISPVFAQSSQQLESRLRQLESKTDQLDDLVETATALESSLSYLMGTNGSPAAIADQSDKLQILINRFNGPLTVITVKANQIGNTELINGAAALDAARSSLQQSLQNMANGPSNFSAQNNLVFELNEMARVIDGCIRREIQEIRRNL